jgi:hypothetical protein
MRKTRLEVTRESCGNWLNRQCLHLCLPQWQSILEARAQLNAPFCYVFGTGGTSVSNGDSNRIREYFVILPRA